MGKPLVLSAALASLIGAAGIASAVLAPARSFAQATSAPSVAEPTPLPPASQVPAETTAPGPGAAARGNQATDHGSAALPKRPPRRSAIER